MPMFSGYSYLPLSFSFTRISSNSSPVQGSSSVGMRMPFSSSTDLRANIASAASQKPTE